MNENLTNTWPAFDRKNSMNLIKNQRQKGIRNMNLVFNQDQKGIRNMILVKNPLIKTFY